MLVASAAEFESREILEMNPSWDSLVFGIGALETESQKQRIQHTAEGRDVLYVGTCGILGPWSEPFLISPSLVSWLPLCERVEQSWPLPEHPVLPLEVLEGLPQGNVLCSTHIAKSGEIHGEIRSRYKADLYENLELYSFARHCLPVCRSLRVLLGVSNEVCLEGRLQWKAHYKKLAQMSAEWSSMHLGEKKVGL